MSIPCRLLGKGSCMINQQASWYAGVANLNPKRFLIDSYIQVVDVNFSEFGKVVHVITILFSGIHFRILSIVLSHRLNS